MLCTTGLLLLMGERSPETSSVEVCFSVNGVMGPVLSLELAKSEEYVYPTLCLFSEGSEVRFVETWAIKEH